MREKIAAVVVCPKLKRVESVLFAFLILLIAVWKMGSYYETNDDVYTAALLSGAMTKAPTGFVAHQMGFGLTFFLSLLYRLTVNIPWYGLFLLFCLFLFLEEVTYSFLQWAEHIFAVCCAFVAVICIALFMVYEIGMIQYTSAAALLSFGGYVALISYRNHLAGMVSFGLLEALAFLLRDQAMLMCIPFGFALLLAFCILSKEYRRFAGELILLFAILGLCIGIDYLAYSGEDWNRYQQFNKTRVQVFDFAGTPDYEEIEDICVQNGVGPEEYEAYCKYCMLDMQNKSGFARDLLAFTEKKTGHTAVSEILDKLILLSPDGEEWAISIGLLFGCLCFVAAVLVKRRWPFFLAGAGLLAAHFCVWGYLLYKGRILHRVSFPLYVGEMTLWLALAFYCYLQEEKKEETRGFLQKYVLGCGIVALFLGMLFFAGKSGKLQYRYVAEQNRGQQAFMQGLYEVQDYCRQNGDRHFLLDSYSFSYYKGSALDEKPYGEQNYVLTGGWFSLFPEVEAYNRSYLKKPFYFIVGDENKEPLLRYLVQKCKVEPTFVERLKTTPGGEYDVYAFAKGFVFDEER